MRDCPAAGLPWVIDLLQDKGMHSYHRIYAGQADIYRSLARHADALLVYQRALARTRQAAEQPFLQRRIGDLDLLLMEKS